MLRLKDLFKIDFSSKGGGKLADKIFNKYNITKEEREEVKNEIANGTGGGGDSEEIEYYMFNIKSEEFIDILNELVKNFTFRVFLYFCNEIIFIYSHYEDGTFINKVGSGMYATDSNGTSSASTVPIGFLNIINDKYYNNTYIKDCSMRKLYDNMFKNEFNIEFDDLFIKITKEEYNDIQNVIGL